MLLLLQKSFDLSWVSFYCPPTLKYGLYYLDISPLFFYTAIQFANIIILAKSVEWYTHKKKGHFVQEEEPALVVCDPNRPAREEEDKENPLRMTENRCGGRGGCVSRLAQLRYS